MRGILPAHVAGSIPASIPADSFFAPNPSRGLSPARSLRRGRWAPPRTTPKALKNGLLLPIVIPGAVFASVVADHIVESDGSVADPPRIHLGRPRGLSDVGGSDLGLTPAHCGAVAAHSSDDISPLFTQKMSLSHKNSGASSTSSGHGAPATVDSLPSGHIPRVHQHDTLVILGPSARASGTRRLRTSAPPRRRASGPPSDAAGCRGPRWRPRSSRARAPGRAPATSRVRAETATSFSVRIPSACRTLENPRWTRRGTARARRRGGGPPPRRCAPRRELLEQTGVLLLHAGEGVREEHEREALRASVQRRRRGGRIRHRDVHARLHPDQPEVIHDPPRGARTTPPSSSPAWARASASAYPAAAAADGEPPLCGALAMVMRSGMLTPPVASAPEPPRLFPSGEPSTWARSSFSCAIAS